MPWIEIQDVNYRFFGFWSGKKELTEIHLLGSAFPKGIPKEYYRLVKDYVTRFVYPHMRPDLTPKGISPQTWGGFHGQHKESLNEYKGGKREQLREAFAVKPNEVIINGGAYLGFGDLMLSQLIPEGHIYAVEAESACYSRLQHNLEYNHVTNVTADHKALWNRIEVLNLETTHAQANSLISEIQKGDGKESVHTTTIDAIVKEHRLTKVDMISLTLNGAEVETLQGAERTIRDFRPRFRLAGWYHRDGMPIWKHAKSALEPKGYEVFTTPRGNVLAIPSGEK